MRCSTTTFCHCSLTPNSVSWSHSDAQPKPLGLAPLSISKCVARNTFLFGMRETVCMGMTLCTGGCRCCPPWQPSLLKMWPKQARMALSSCSSYMSSRTVLSAKGLYSVRARAMYNADLRYRVRSLFTVPCTGWALTQETMPSL